MNLLQTLWANKHTSTAAVVYVVAKLAVEIGAIWLPAHKAQFEGTANVIESAAVAYGLLAAGDGKQRKDEQ